MGLDLKNGVHDDQLHKFYGLHPGLAVDLKGGGVSVLNSRIHIIDCNIENCFSHHGGGMFVLGGQVHISGCVFKNNACGHHGGGIMLNTSMQRENDIDGRYTRMR